MIRESSVNAWLDPTACPSERPPLESMSASTRGLHESIDAHIRRSGIPYLHPEEPTVQLDLLGASQLASLDTPAE